ncbi:lipoyl synthase [Buchnera aphidicola]|uniref:lipoyl synthase n=1 Tax=Buchnera aphidicola TaxID=9 RepID=UPI003464CF96
MNIKKKILFINKNINIPVKNIENIKSSKKPNWIKVKIPLISSKIYQIKKALRENNLHSVCEEANCPNLPECFNKGTATFMILGSICTRNCPFCAVKHGKPDIINIHEPIKLANTIFDMNIKYVVITSVVRDDLYDGGAQHFVDCMKSIRDKNNVQIEILVPDFRGRINLILNIFNKELPNVFNHNIENVPRLYKIIRPGANYSKSLILLQSFKKKYSNIPTKSGLMVGLGETEQELIAVMKDLYSSGVSLLTIGQYLQPSSEHFPVQRYISPLEFEDIRKEALSIGFTHAFCGPLVRSSYHADIQANAFIK